MSKYTCSLCGPIAKWDEESHGAQCTGTITNSDELQPYCYCEPCEWQPCECEPCGVCLGLECPACGDPIDYCQGHGEIGDPEGYALLQRLEG